MRKKWWILGVVIFLIALVVTLLVLPKGEKNKKQDGKLRIVTSFYPIYIMTANITQGANNVEMVSLSSNQVGCLHDYTLVTSDMKKLETADIFIQNGLGLENFIDKIIQAYPDLKMIDSTKEIMNKIQENGQVNPHTWTSIGNYSKQLETIYQKLCEYNPENELIYTKNYEEYGKALNDLNLRYNTQLQNLNGKKAICLNEALTYLAKDLQMEVTNISTNHEESTLSADTIKNIIEKMKQENIKLILIGEEDNLRNAQTLAQETGAEIIKLQTGLSGELNKTSYLTIMEGNLVTLKQVESSLGIIDAKQ